LLRFLLSKMDASGAANLAFHLFMDMLYCPLRFQISEL
jgi:hypothetical protein